MAIFSEDQWMIAALQEGQGDFFDTHMMPVCFPWIEEEYGTVAEYKKQKPVEHKEDRTKVKAVQYGLAFDRGALAIAKDLKLTVSACQYIINNYLARASNFAQWRVDVKHAAITPARRDMLINPFGRRYQSEVITSSNFRKVQREALSFLPQSTASDICLSTAMRINKQLQENDYHIFNVVHDAIMIEGPRTGADETGRFVVEQLRKTGLQVMGPAVPFLAEYDVGDSWSDLG
jgi:DNA polymerase-1